MPFLKLTEVHISDENACILITTPHEILINRGLSRLTIFDHNFVQKGEIEFPERLFIYAVFKKFSGDELLLYSVDEEDGDRLAYADLRAGTSCIISSVPDRITFSPIYQWSQDLFLLSDYHENFYSVWIKEKRVVQEIRSNIQENNPFFYKFYKEALLHRAERVYPELFQYIYTDEDESAVCFVDVKKKVEKRVNNVYPRAHDYEYQDGIFLLIGEQKIVALNAFESEGEVVIYPEKRYHFMRSSFLTNNRIVTFASYRENRVLTLYEVDTNNEK